MLACIQYLPRICTLMVAEAEPMAFLSFNSYLPLLRRFASLMSIDARSLVFSTHRSALVCNSLSSLNHSIVGSGLPEMPALSFTDVPALYLTTSVYSRGKSITGPPARKTDEEYLKDHRMKKIIATTSK